MPAYADGLETVTLYRRLSPSTFDAGTTVTNVLRRAATREELAAAGASLKQTGLVWHLWAANVAGPGPKVNDVVQDADGVRWSVLRADKQTLGTRHRLTTIREV